MLGWLFDVSSVIHVARLPAMQPNTALCLVACGLSLAIPRRAAGFARALAAFAIVIGALTAVEYATGRDLGIDDVFLTGTMRMAPQTSIALTMMGLALLARRAPGREALAQPLAALPVTLCYLSLVGLLFDAKVPVFPLATTMALSTATALLLVGLGVAWSQPERGLPARWLSPGPGGRTVRVLLPAFVVLPPLLAVLQEAGVAAGLFDRGFGMALDATMIMVLLAAGVLVHSRSLDATADARSREAERFRHIVENIPEGVGVMDLCGQVLYANERLSALLGRGVGPGLSLTECVEPHVRVLFLDFLKRAEHHPTRATVAVRAADGELRSLRFSATPVPDPLAQRHRGTLVFVIDDTSRRIAEAHVRERARQLEHALRDLEAFATLASHELREPLRKIQLLADSAAADPAFAGAADDVFPRIRGSAALLQARVANLLAYSRLGASARIVPNVDVGAVVREAEAASAERLRSAGASVLVGVLPTIDGDPTLLRDLFTTLLDNALRSRRADVPPVIRITSAPRTGGRVEITVADNGTGLDEDEVGHLFEVFRATRGQPAGTGIGLATCRRIAELHGGEITARGTPGEGSVFTLSLPVRAHLGVPPECVPADVP